MQIFIQFFITAFMFLTFSCCTYAQSDSTKVDTLVTKKNNRATVHVEFTVSKSGNITRVKALKTECDGCNAALIKQFEREAVRVVQQAPKRNLPVKEVKHVQPVVFVIED
jgi:TonB family protein